MAYHGGGPKNIMKNPEMFHSACGHMGLLHKNDLSVAKVEAKRYIFTLPLKRGSGALPEKILKIRMTTILLLFFFSLLFDI